MIFVVAAYTITLGVLAFYGVLLQHRERVYGAAVGPIGSADATGEGGGASRGFNLGAMLLAPFWMWSHGMRLPGTILLGLEAGAFGLFLRGPGSGAGEIGILLLSIVLLAASVALGVVGNRVAVRHRGPESLAAFSASQFPWAVAGIVVYTVVLPWAWYFFVYPSG